MYLRRSIRSRLTFRSLRNNATTDIIWTAPGAGSNYRLDTLALSSPLVVFEEFVVNKTVVLDFFVSSFRGNLRAV